MTPPEYPATSFLVVKDAFSELWRDDNAKLFIYLRTAATSTHAELLERMIAFEKHTATAPSRSGLVMDVRCIRGDDGNFKSVVLPALATVADRFSRVALVTFTVSGGMQAQQISRVGGFSMRVTTSLADALAFCCGEHDDESPNV